MRFLADESCDIVVVRTLRSAGHDVLSVAESARGAKDPAVLALARNEQRVLLTEDKGFGRLVYAAGQGALGVVLLRFPARARRLLEAAVLEAVARLEEQLARSFTVVEPGRVRVSKPFPPPA
jgi:predicted nuclease of predicted toxin-antitoxin system